MIRCRDEMCAGHYLGAAVHHFEADELAPVVALILRALQGSCTMECVYRKKSLSKIPGRMSGSNAIARAISHCCANSRHQWDGFAGLPSLRLLNLCVNNSTALEFTIEESLEYFGNSTVQYPLGMKLGPYPVEWIKANGTGKRLVVDVDAEDRNEAKRMADELNGLPEREFVNRTA